MKQISAQIDPRTAAKEAGLTYTSDTNPGITRKQQGKTFVYFDSKNKQVSNKDSLERIKSLVIPPAWKNVWISESPKGHIQATGIDSKGRKQYKYHPSWRAYRSSTNFHRMEEFSKLLPRIREQVTKDLHQSKLTKEKVIATLIKIMEQTFIRIGNEEYEHDNKSYGLTTLKDKHVKIKGSKILFNFKGKSGVEHEILLTNPTLAKIVKKCQDLPGQDLFQYIDEEGVIQDIKSQDVNNYLKNITREHFTAKDYRTWGGSINAIKELERLGNFENQTEAKKNVVQVVKNVASILGNRPATCKKHYIIPQIFETYYSEQLFSYCEKAKGKKHPGYICYEELIIKDVSTVAI